MGEPIFFNLILSIFKNTIMSTLADMKILLKQLRAENDPSNAELIAYYEKMIPTWTIAAYNKAINNIGRFNVRKK